mmetsp:Transcript_173241/g.555643  ORF Transcript_173241/g.555643 Transcript_173241/m.555643 type:complete len:398 (+) Transcript_173241:74-1267(+)
MALRSVVKFAVLGLAAARVAEWKPASDGVAELDAVEIALKRVDGMGMDAQQKKAAKSVVQDVEKVLANVQSNHNLTKDERKAQVKGAIGKLQSLQSQWQLAAVESSLTKLVTSGHLSPDMWSEAKKVAASVNSVVDQIEAGKLVGDKQRTEVAGAIKQLQSLQQDMQKVASTSNVTKLEQELAEKKALLAKDEKELQVFGLQKKLLEKKMQLQRLIGEKQAVEKSERQRSEAAAQTAQIAQLVEAAKVLAVTKKSTTKTVVSRAAGKPTTALPPQMEAILADLSARAQNVSADLAKMDAEEKKNQANLRHTLDVASKAKVYGKRDSIVRGADVIHMMSKRERRQYLKARTMKILEMKDLTDGIQSIKTGDVKALTKLLNKMQHENKQWVAKTQGFLH